mmetsp:Transcript_45687/g.114502  ORF Transcript_45687/g.114502 Transcript_45687/m.114502 type:complete len:201 (-) Transcript_45687:395-997(-)
MKLDVRLDGLLLTHLRPIGTRSTPGDRGKARRVCGPVERLVAQQENEAKHRLCHEIQDPVDHNLKVGAPVTGPLREDKHHGVARPRRHQEPRRLVVQLPDRRVTTLDKRLERNEGGVDDGGKDEERDREPKPLDVPRRNRRHVTPKDHHHVPPNNSSHIGPVSPSDEGKVDEQQRRGEEPVEVADVEELPARGGDEPSLA